MKLLFCGDTAQTVDTKRNKLLSEEVQAIVDEHDFRCLNFEAAMMPLNGKCASKIGPVIIQNVRMAELLKECNFDLFCLANNHIMDCGIEGLREIKSFFNETVMIGAGENAEEAHKTYILEKEEAKIGFLNVAENGFGTSINTEEAGHGWFKHKYVEKRIEFLKHNCDVIILIVHAGAENWDVPLPEIRELYKYYIDLGVDAVIGHHPHTPQGWEKYKNGWIFYSLGNFAFYEGDKAKNPTKTISVSMTIKEKKIVECNPIYTEFIDGKVCISIDKAFIEHIEYCNKVLSNSALYWKIVNEKCLNVVKNDTRMNYSRILGMYYPLTFSHMLKSLIRRWVLREKFNNMWLYHNILIETHLWIAQRGVKILVDRTKEAGSDVDESIIC